MQLAPVLSAVIVSCLIVGLGADEPQDQIRGTLKNLNKAIAQRKLDTVRDGDVSLKLKLFQLDLKNGHFGDLSTLNYEDVRTAGLVKRDSSEGALYEYDVFVSLSDCSYHYNYSYVDALKIFKLSGMVSLRVNKNQARVRGNILIKEDGSCQAVLSSAEVNRLTNVQVTITPENMFDKIVSFVSQFVRNYFMSSRYTASLNKDLAKKIEEEEFKSSFSELLCTSFVH